MSETVFTILAVVFGLLAVSGAVGLAEYAVKAVAGRRADGEVVRLERDGRPSADAVVVRFEADGQPVEVRNFSFLAGLVFLRVGSRLRVAYFRDPAGAVVLDGSELFQRAAAFVIAAGMACGFLFAARHS